MRMWQLVSMVRASLTPNSACTMTDLLQSLLLLSVSWSPSKLPSECLIPLDPLVPPPSHLLLSELHSSLHRIKH